MAVVNESIEYFWWLPLATISLWVCYTDISKRKILNYQTTIIFALCLSLMVYHDLYENYLHTILIFSIGLITFSFGFIGAGDVKLLTAFSLAIRPDYIPIVMMLISFCGLVLIWSQHIFEKYDNSNRYFSPTYGVPYGVAISIGANLGIALTILSGK